MSGALFNAVAKLCFYVPSDLHTEAVQAALAKYKERKMPMPSKRRSVLVQSSVEACTPPGETSVPMNLLFSQARAYPVSAGTYRQAPKHIHTVYISTYLCTHSLGLCSHWDVYMCSHEHWSVGC